MGMATTARFLDAMENLQRNIHEWANSRGWWESKEQRNIPSKIALMHSELSEALEIHREPLRFADGVELKINEVGYRDKASGLIEREQQMPDNPRKPEGFGVELADCIIRILDAAAFLGIDVGRILLEKQSYNETRPHKHGGKRC